jgi:hypothetical protein
MVGRPSRVRRRAIGGMSVHIAAIPSIAIQNG